MIEGGLSARDCAALTVGQWWAVFIQGGKKPVDWDRLREKRNEQRRKAGKPPLRPREG